MCDTPETFWTLLHNFGHWEFELFLIFIFDVLIGFLIWPFLNKRITHYKNCKKIPVKRSYDPQYENVWIKKPPALPTKQLTEIIQDHIDENRLTKIERELIISQMEQ